MRYLKQFFLTLFIIGSGVGYAAANNANSQEIVMQNKQIIFVNASANKNGNTFAYAQNLLEGYRYQQLNLVDYKIYPLGANFTDDQFNQVYQQISQYDVIVIGTPVYWHTVSGALKNFLDRTYEKEGENKLKGKTLIFIVQGFDPTPISIEQMDFMMQRFANKYDLDFVGIAHNRQEIAAIKARIH